MSLLNSASSVSTRPCRLCSDIFKHFQHVHLDRILLWKGDGKEVERKIKIKERWMTGGRKWRREKHQREVSVEAGGDEEEGKSPSNTRASFASNSPSTEAA